MYRNTVEFLVSGDYALFSEPMMRVSGEKTSLHVPTYEALKGILSSVYWKPTFIWYIDEVRIMNPIQTETKGVKTLNNNGTNDLSYYTYLTHVAYQVRAHFEWNPNRENLKSDRNENKHHNIAKRMIERGGRRDIFLGTRECQGYVEPCTFGEGKGFYDDMPGEISYGVQYHGITYPDEAVLADDKDWMTVRLWKPVMKNGVIKFIRPEECTLKRHIRKMDIKPFGTSSHNFESVDQLEKEVTLIELDAGNDSNI
ncbi:type I-C CRISPR-associated protein Cas5c [Catenisphaera adipataccumulans]|jgi:CRISPR-associated protein Cas5d|uniref:pre-crRNA processing endonuclease n=1 Tax=Catenisphaera adipataccumulans TaxID=700500 RepID=A0A7W8CYY3_9FIRM|nr:type I-C CRISPR-associated protein Cas5c [Catenisphaera adipataccumulans]MBB5183946.1 CRISPR-associated protein Cas5d [Catenisphaera adipataccumulans]